MKKPPLFRPNKSSGPKFDGKSHIKEMYKTTAWTNYSKEFLKVNDKCYACGKPSQVTDHLLPHKGSKALFEQLDNHIPLCARCHNTCTALFDRFSTPKLEDKLRWLKRCRDRLGLTFRVFVMPTYNTKSS